MLPFLNLDALGFRNTLNNQKFSPTTPKTTRTPPNIYDTRQPFQLDQGGVDTKYT